MRETGTDGEEYDLLLIVTVVSTDTYSTTPLFSLILKSAHPGLCPELVADVHQIIAGTPGTENDFDRPDTECLITIIGKQPGIPNHDACRTLFFQQLMFHGHAGSA